MNWEDNVLDPSRISFEGDFYEQVHNILSFVRLTADEVQNLENLFEDLEYVLQHLAPGCKIHPFGSIVTGLGIRTSDVDCYVALPNGMQPTKQYVIIARNILKRYHRKFTQVFAIAQAKVPIVKFLHRPTNCHCDVNFKSPSGVQNSQLITFFLDWDSRVLPLTVLVKYWAKVHKFTGTNRMANYALTMMVIFYLQVNNILPPVCDLQRNVPSYMIDNWNSAFDDSMQSYTSNSDTLYDLMGGFFKYYSTFNYKENIIAPYVGFVINKKCFDNLNNIPQVYYLYKQHVQRKLCPKLRSDSKLCVQDPFEHNRNCSITVFDKLMDSIILHLRFAAKKFEEDQDNSFLRAILTEDQDSVPQPSAKNKFKHVFLNKVKKHNRKQMQRGVRHGVNMILAPTNKPMNNATKKMN